MKRRILVVDDELDMRTFISTLLETSGYKPFVAENGEKGYALAKERKPDLIVLDIMMPKESGMNLYRRLRSDSELNSIPIVVVSGIAKKTFMHSQKIFNEYSGDTTTEPEAYLEKPPSAEELLHHVTLLTRK